MTTHAVASDNVWIPCPICWGQRRLYQWNADLQTHAKGTCARCMGIGEIPNPKANT